jgi:hypothetical protein
VDWFRQHTGRQTPRPGGYSELVGLFGRQAGKDDAVSDSGNARAVHALLTNEDVSGLYISFICQDHRSSVRTLFHRVSQPWTRIPELAQYVVARTSDSLTLTNGLTLAAYPCRPHALRGLRNLLVVMNEVAFMFHATDGNPVGVEMRRAVLPTLATTGGKLLIVSSPYLQTDLLGDLHRRHWGHDESPTLVVQASAPEMNPTLPEDYLQRMREDDPEAFASEVMGEFRPGTSSLFDPAALESSVGNWREQAPRTGVRYQAHFDPSGGKSDAAALSIAHREDQRVIVDLVRAWPSPHNVESVAGEAAVLARSYGVSVLTVDRYAPGHVEQLFSRFRVRARPTQIDTSALFLELLSRVMSSGVVIPNDPALLKELRSLERRRGFAGKDRCGHRPGAHDDRAAALAGVTYAAGKPPRYMGVGYPVLGF